MIKKILILLLSCLCTVSHATKWTKIADGKQTIFIDLNSIKKNSGFVFYSSLQNMTSMGLNSVIIDNKADCNKENVIEFNVTYYGQTMGKGVPYEDENDDDKVIYPEIKTAKYKLMKFACKYQK